MDGLLGALTQIYNDQESASVLQLTQKVAAVFAKGNRFADSVELEALKQLKADAQASEDGTHSVKINVAPACRLQPSSHANTPHGSPRSRYSCGALKVKFYTSSVASLAQVEPKRLKTCLLLHCSESLMMK